jgi:hypothetical protein
MNKVKIALASMVVAGSVIAGAIPAVAVAAPAKPAPMTVEQRAAAIQKFRTWILSLNLNFKVIKK